MALTKEKLISRLQTQVGLSKQESRSNGGTGLDIMKESWPREKTCSSAASENSR